MFAKGFQGQIFNDLSRHWGEADQPAVLQMFFLALFKDTKGICFPSVFMNLFQSPWLFKDNREWPCNYNGQVSSCSEMYLVEAHRLMHIQFKCSLIWSSMCKGISFLLSTFLEAWQSWRSILEQRMRQKRHGITQPFFHHSSKCSSTVISRDLHILTCTQWQLVQDS